MRKTKKIGLASGIALTILASISSIHAQTFIGAAPSFTAVAGADMEYRPAAKGDRLGPDPGTWAFARVATGFVVASGFWLRSSPSASADVIRAIPEGARVEAKLGHAEGDIIWWHVNWIDDASGRTSGWINSEAVSVDLPPNA